MLVNDSIRYLISDNSNYEFPYIGIGGPETPEKICRLFHGLAEQLSQKGCVLRSGGDLGGDAAFEAGALFKDIFLPYPSYNSNQSRRWSSGQECIEIARDNHPAWHRCSEFAKKYHARMVKVVLGEELLAPAKFLVCWTPDGAFRQDQVSAKTGMARVAISLAIQRGIPVLNLGNLNHAEILARLLTVVPGDRSDDVNGTLVASQSIPEVPKKRGFKNLK